MSNENQNLPNADGKQNAEETNNQENSLINETNPSTEETKTTQEEVAAVPSENEEKIVQQEESKDFDESADLDQHANDVDEDEEEDQDADELSTEKDSKNYIEEKDYEELSLPQLVAEASLLLGKYSAVQAKKSFQRLKDSFIHKFEEIEKAAKEAFVEKGGSEIDFRYESKDKRDFDKLYYEHKNKLKEHYHSVELEQQNNLKERESIISELKALYTEPSENNSDIFKKFRSLKTRWHNAGRIPKANANNIFKTYYHHLDNFYEFLDLNQELRKMDFDHNLEVRKSIIEQAKKLLEETNIQKALNELQYLHRMWKEEAVPVAEEYREPTWQEFKAITNKIHDKKNELSEQIQERQEQNLKLKEEVIQKIKDLTENQVIKSHNLWQKKIKALKKLREEFFAIGRVPKENNQPTWDKFKEVCREFNRQKNTYYKEMKKEQSKNLEAKKRLVEIAQEHRHSTNWADSVNVVKRIQNEWKKVGHVPRKYSDKLWEEFSAANNEFFERYKNRNNEKIEEQQKNLEKKEQLIQEIKDATPPTNKDELLKWVNDYSIQFSSIGFVPNGKQEINQEFHKVTGKLLKAAGLSENAVKNAQWNQKVEGIKDNLDSDRLRKMKSDIKREIDDLQREVTQLQNNLAFFSNADDSNPLLKHAKNNIEKKVNELKNLKHKYHDLRLINLDAIAETKTEEEAQSTEDSATEEE